MNDGRAVEGGLKHASEIFGLRTVKCENAEIAEPNTRFSIFAFRPAFRLHKSLRFIGTRIDRPMFEADAGKQVIRYRSATVAGFHGIPFALASSYKRVW